jgi:hypothetical protein
VYVHLVFLTVPGCPAARDCLPCGQRLLALRPETALTVILLGFKNGRAGRMARVRLRTAGCGAQPCGGPPGVRASAAAAVGCSTKASGRRLVRRAPRGRVASAFCCMRQLSRRTAYAVRRRQARGALGAPLKP